ncbi:MAG: purple acid phosphatase family protein [Planctomycetota bacterium]
MLLRSFPILLLVLSAGSAVTGQTVVRGPYIQQTTETSAILRWRTSAPTDSRVVIGVSPGGNLLTITDPDTVTDHEVLVSGLSTDTLHHYQVGTTTQILAGGGADHHFRTHPPIGSTDPVRIWAIGDAGTADGNQAAVRDAYYAHAGLDSTDVWLLLGDNAYDNGTDAEYQGALFDMYEALLRRTPFWATRGNHENNAGVHYGLCSNPTGGEAGGAPSGTEAFYSFDHGNVHFVCLDSDQSDRSPTGPMLTWLAADLAGNLQPWTIAFWHHPPYTKGSHDSDDPSDSGGRMEEMRQNALPILEAGGVDLVLSGHSHCYERSNLIDGHYGLSPTFDPLTMLLDGGDGSPTGNGAYEKTTGVANDGAVYIVMGSSGKTGGGTFDHPVMEVSFSQLGSLVIDVQGNTLTGTMLRDTSATPDIFQIVKDGGSGGPEFRRGSLSSSQTVTISDAIIILQGLFMPGFDLLCQDAADVDDDGALTIADPIALLGWLFQGGPTPASPGPGCGTDPTPDALDCATSPNCP